MSSKLLVERASDHKVFYQIPKKRIDLQSQKTIPLLITFAISLNIQTDKFVYRSDLETTILASFPSKSLSKTAIILFLQKLSIFTMASFTISTRTDITLQTGVKQMRAVTIRSAFTPDCGYGNYFINLIGEFYCSNVKCSGKVCMHEKTCQFPAEAIINVCNARLCARCAKFHLKNKQIPLS